MVKEELGRSTIMANIAGTWQRCMRQVTYAVEKIVKGWWFRLVLRHLLETSVDRNDTCSRTIGRTSLPTDRWSNDNSSKVTLPKTIGRTSWSKPTSRIRPSSVSLPTWVKSSQSFLYYFLMKLWIVYEVPSRGYCKANMTPFSPTKSYTISKAYQRYYVPA